MIFLRLKITIKLFSDLIIYRDELEKRFRKSCTPFHFLAYQMDPKYQGELLQVEHHNIITDWVSKRYPEFVQDIQYFHKKDILKYPSYMFNEDLIKKMDAGQWWNAMEKKSSNMSNGPNTNFCTLMKQLTMLPSSAAGIERIFSSFGVIWTKLRNALGDKKAVKLVKLYRYYNCNKG